MYIITIYNRLLFLGMRKSAMITAWNAGHHKAITGIIFFSIPLKIIRFCVSKHNLYLK